MRKFDFVVVGGGSAGYAAARTAVDEGLATAVIEGGPEVGGLCILRGCMPSKAIIESANRFMTLKRAGEFGLRASGLEIHAPEIISRKRRLIADFADYRKKQLVDGRFVFIRGFAKFVDGESIEIQHPDGSEELIGFRSAIIATGSTIAVPPVPGLADVPFLTSDDTLDLEELPESLIVLGAGPVALEMAHYFAALDVRVTIIQRSSQLLTGMDPEAAGALEAAFKARGISVFTGTSITAINSNADGVEVTFEHANRTQTVSAARLLNALGRQPATTGLGLEGIRVETSRKLVKTNARQQTSRAHIFAAGDCSGPLEVVHVAIKQGEIAARNAARLLAGSAESTMESTDYRLKLFAVFTEPQVAAVGFFSEAEARAVGISPICASYPFDDHGKSLVMSESEGFVKLMADSGSGEIIGGCVVGPHASDLIHEIVVAMHFRSTAAQLAAVPHYHPTLSEIWLYPAEELANAISHRSA